MILWIHSCIAIKKSAFLEILQCKNTIIMKHNNILAVIFILALFMSTFMLGCKKEKTCECTTKTSTQTSTYEQTIKKGKCKDLDKKIETATITCTKK